MFLTPGKIAKMFGVAPRTVVKWIDTGLMTGHCIPGSQHRRVAVAEVMRFAQEHKVPLPEEAPESSGIVIAADGSVIVGNVMS